MRTFVITLLNDEYSERVAKRCIDSAAKFGVDVEKYPAVNKLTSESLMCEFGLKWTWADNNTRITKCPLTGLRQHPYKGANLQAKIGCSMSHFLLWKKCVELDQPILILEHDTIFVRDFPKDINFKGICQINNPRNATPKGAWWSDHMKKRGTEGVHEKTWVRKPNERMIPDGLAGNSAYMIKPFCS